MTIHTAPVSHRRVTKREAPSAFGRDHLKALKPASIAAILSSAAGGNEDDWFDLVDKMEDTDEHLAGQMGTRKHAIASREIIVEPANESPAAVQSAELFKRALDDVPDLESIIRDMMQGVFAGRAVHEHVFRRRGTYSYSIPEWIDPRNTRFGADWGYQIRLADNSWAELPDGKFMVHAPRERSTIPTKTALLRSITWLWLFKYWGWAFWVNGAERTNNPYVTGKTPRSSDKQAKIDLLADLEKLSADHVAVLDEGTAVEIHNMNFGTSAEVWDKMVTRVNEGMTKLILGSTTNTEIGDTGGAYSAAQSQAVITIEPRIEADARAIANTVKYQWAQPHLNENAHLIAGEPVLPLIRLAGADKHEDIPEHIFDALYQSGSLTRNQVLTMAGLPPVDGGDQPIAPPAAAPAFTQPRGAAAPVPFSRTSPRPRSQQSLPWTSPTRSASLSPIGSAPPPKSGDR